jgi:hypothetical protein
MTAWVITSILREETVEGKFADAVAVARVHSDECCGGTVIISDGNDMPVAELTDGAVTLVV